MNTATILAHSSADSGNAVPLLFMAAGLLIPLFAVTLYVFCPPRLRSGEGEEQQPAAGAVTSMHDELWRLVEAVEQNRFSRADLGSRNADSARARTARR